MLGFIRLSPQLLQQLKSSEILLYYAIEHFHFSDKGCYASNKTLMRISGIGCNRKYAAIKRRLIDGGYITEINGVRYTLFERGGVGILKSFLFSSEYSSTEKVYNILRFLNPRETKIELAKRMQVSCRTLQRCSVVPFASFVVQTKPQSRVGQNHIPSNAFKQLINNTTNGKSVGTTRSIPVNPTPVVIHEMNVEKEKTNGGKNNNLYQTIFGETVSIPENTNPAAIQELEIEEVEKDAAKEALIIQEEIKKISFDLFDKRSSEAELLFQDLRRIFPRIADKPIWQSIWQALRNEKKIKGTLLGYSIGILKPFIKTFPDRNMIPTIADTDSILRLKKRSIENRIKTQENQKLEDLQENEERKKFNENKEFYSSLSEKEKEHLKPIICKIGNPYNLPFITHEFAITGCLGMVDFKERFDAERALFSWK